MHRSVPRVSRADLIAVSDARVFFAHQSVGRAVLDAVPRLYAAHGLPSLRVSDLADADADDRLVHTRIGQNGDPLGKIHEYADLVRGGVGDWADATVLKLCYSDVRAETDVAGIFAAHHETLSTLTSEYPDVVFVPATVPLTTKQGRAGMLKRWLGRGGQRQHRPADNVAREDFNTLVRREYSQSGCIFDIARIESTAESGRRVVGRHQGRIYHALDRASARDHGHLTEHGAETVAASLLVVIASALRD